MATSLPISETIRSLADLEACFGLQVTADAAFFPEWKQAESSPVEAISEMEQRTLFKLRDRFVAHRYRGTVDEGSVDKLLLSPLLDLAGFMSQTIRFGRRLRWSLPILRRMSC